MAIELAEFLDRETGLEKQEGFIVDTEQKANWALRKIKQLQEKMDANADLAAEEIARIEMWEKEVNEGLHQSILFFTRLLERYHRGVYEENPDIKTIKLPHGQLKMRAQQPKFVRDDDKLLAWMKKEWPDIHPYYIKITERPDWKDLKDFLEVCGDKMVDPESGLIVEGVEVIAREPKFSLEVK